MRERTPVLVLLTEVAVVLVTAVPAVPHSVTHLVCGEKVCTDTAGLVTPVRAVPGAVTPGHQGDTLGEGGALELLLRALHLVVVKLQAAPRASRDQICPLLV